MFFVSRAAAARKTAGEGVEEDGALGPPGRDVADRRAVGGEKEGGERERADFGFVGVAGGAGERSGEGEEGDGGEERAKFHRSERGRGESTRWRSRLRGKKKGGSETLPYFRNFL